MKIIEAIVAKISAIIHGVADTVHKVEENIKERIAEHFDIPPAELAARLEHLAANDPQKLNWRTSIVDFLKLLELDSSLATRKQMAAELGNDDYDGRADDNVWLHGEVFEALIKRGIPLPPADKPTALSQKI